MSATKDWQVVFKVEGLECPAALCWEISADDQSILNVTMNGDWYANVDVRLVDGVTADEVKKALRGMYLERFKARMPEPLRGLQATIEEKIDEWFANQTYQT